MDGWNEDKIYNALEVIDEIQSVSYELKNCVKGCYTGCHTYEELGKYLQELGERLCNEGEGLTYEKEDPEDDE